MKSSSMFDILTGQMREFASKHEPDSLKINVPASFKVHNRDEDFQELLNLIRPAMTSPPPALIFSDSMDRALGRMALVSCNFADFELKAATSIEDQDALQRSVEFMAFGCYGFKAPTNGVWRGLHHVAIPRHDDQKLAVDIECDLTLFEQFKAFGYDPGATMITLDSLPEDFVKINPVAEIQDSVYLMEGPVKQRKGKGEKRRNRGSRWH